MNLGIETIIIIGVVLVFFYIVFSSFKVLPEYERIVVLRLGKYAGTRGPGLTILIPFLEGGRRVDMRERFLEIPRQTAISKDNTSIDIDFLVYYRVVNPKLSVLEIENVVQASLNIAATTLRAVIGDIELDDVLAKREQINDVLRVKLDEVTERWGLKITRVEIREVEPPPSVKDAMNRQMASERERRATVTKAEGERSAAVMVAEGEKTSAILRSEGEKLSLVLRAQGEQEAQLLLAQGRAAALQALYQEAKDLDENTMVLQYLDTLRAVGSSPSTKFILPMELTSMMSRLIDTMQRNAISVAPAPSAPAPAAPPVPPVPPIPPSET